MRYKAWADTDLIDAVLARPDLMTVKEGQYATAIIRHYHTVDCIFKAHLLGVPHGFTSPNPAEPATVAELKPLVRAVDDWYVAYALGLDEGELAEKLNLTFTDGEQQLLTRSEILLHVALHGGGHRGQVSLILRMFGATPPPDRLTSYLNRLQNVCG
jgi:uncharacterized damage-inducible protein DinB